jgi:hypothetical protein
MEIDEKLIKEVRTVATTWFRHRTPERRAIERLIAAYRYAASRNPTKQPTFKKPTAKFLANLPTRRKYHEPVNAVDPERIDDQPTRG